MKILIVLTYYAPHWTGLTEHAKRLGEGLVSRLHSVSVVATNHTNTLKSSENINGVHVMRTNVLFRLSRTVISPFFIPKTVRESISSDVVILYTPLAEILFLVVLLKLLGKKIIIIHNGDLLLPKGMLNQLVESFFDISMYIAGLGADKIISYSDDYTAHSRFLKHFQSKTTPILPLFPREHTTTKMLKLPFKNKKPIIGFAGRFVEEKGFDLLLSAIPYVVQEYPNALFVFAGEQHMIYETFFEKQQQAIEKNQNHFFSFGLLNQNEMISFYKLLDIFVLPSRSDCLAFVQVEAMLLGVPVVVTNIPGARVAVQKTGMGEIVQKENARALADGIIKVYKNKHKYSDSIDKVHRLFGYNKTLSQYEEVVQHI